MVLGEMVARAFAIGLLALMRPPDLPIAGGHITLAKRFADPALSFTMGWCVFARGSPRLTTQQELLDRASAL